MKIGKIEESMLASDFIENFNLLMRQIKHPEYNFRKNFDDIKDFGEDFDIMLSATCFLRTIIKVEEPKNIFSLFKEPTINFRQFIIVKDSVDEDDMPFRCIDGISLLLDDKKSITALDVDVMLCKVNRSIEETFVARKRRQVELRVKFLKDNPLYCC
jgi:hypothetical protein